MCVNKGMPFLLCLHPRARAVHKCEVKVFGRWCMRLHATHAHRGDCAGRSQSVLRVSIRWYLFNKNAAVQRE